MNSQTDSALPSPFHVIVALPERAPWIEACLEAVFAQSLAPARVTVFDAGSRDGAAELVARNYPQARLMRSPVELGLAAGCNRAAASVRDADYLMLLDPDAILSLGVLEHLSAVFARQPALGVLGCKLLDRDVETIRNVGLAVSGNGLPSDLGRGEPDRGQYRGLRDVPAVPIAAMAVRLDVWCETGGLDEMLGPAYYEGPDFCLRARRGGWRVAVACEATVTHFDPWTPRRRDPEGLEQFFRDRARFLIKHCHGGHWLTRYLPEEVRWLRDLESKGMRGVALKTLARAFGGRLRPRSRNSRSRAAA